MLCPACGGFTRNSKTHIRTCLSCHRRWQEDGSELICPPCVRCGGPTGPGGHERYNNRQRYRCTVCGLQSTMDEHSHVSRARVYPTCPHCGGAGIKHGTTHAGTQRWFCKGCQREYTDKARPDCPRCGGPTRKNGHPDGQQAWRCNNCGHGFFGDERGNGKTNGFIRTPTFFGDSEIDAILRYEPAPCPNDRRPCSKCPHVIECGSGKAAVFCEALYVVLSGGSEVWM